MRNQFSNRRQSGTPLFGALLIVILISVVAFGFDSLTGGVVRSYVRTMSALAMTAAGNTVNGIDQSGILETHGMLARENAALKEKIALYEERSAVLHSIEDENVALREMAHLAEEREGITARVLSNFDASPYGTLLIDTGINDGVRIGNKVKTAGGFVLGTVSDADVENATVKTLFAPENSVDLLDGEVAFSATGRGGGNARAEIPRDAKVSVGDSLIAKEFGAPAGVIGSIESASSSATQTLFIRIPVNLNTLQFVYVVE